MQPTSNYEMDTEIRLLLIGIATYIVDRVIAELRRRNERAEEKRERAEIKEAAKLAVEVVNQETVIQAGKIVDVVKQNTDITREAKDLTLIAKDNVVAALEVGNHFTERLQAMEKRIEDLKSSLPAKADERP